MLSDINLLVRKSCLSGKLSIKACWLQWIYLLQFSCISLIIWLDFTAVFCASLINQKCFFVDFSAPKLDCHWFFQWWVKTWGRDMHCVTQKCICTPPLYYTVSGLNCVDWTSTYFQTHMEQLWIDNVVTMRTTSWDYFGAIRC